MCMPIDSFGFQCLAQGQAEEILASGPMPCRGFLEAFRIGHFRGPVHISVAFCSFHLCCVQGFMQNTDLSATDLFGTDLL